MDPKQTSQPVQAKEPVVPNPPAPEFQPPVTTVVAPQNGEPNPPPEKPSIFSSKWAIIGVVLLFLIPIVLALIWFFFLRGNNNQNAQAIPTPMPIATQAPTEEPLPTEAPTIAPTIAVTSTPTPTVVSSPSASPTP